MKLIIFTHLIFNMGSKQLALSYDIHFDFIHVLAETHLR